MIRSIRVVVLKRRDKRIGSIFPKKTAQLLIDAKKEAWIEKRQDEVQAKGKGTLSTYWLKGSSGGSSDDAASLSSMNNSSHHHTGNVNIDAHNDDKNGDVCSCLSLKDLRLVEWNVDILSRLLRQMQAQRNDSPGSHISARRLTIEEEQECFSPKYQHGVLEEVQDIISLTEPLPSTTSPRSRRVDYAAQAEHIALSPVVVQELRRYVVAIASMYNKNNPFHCFEHAAHVTMSTCKLLSRVVESASSAGDNYGSSTTDGKSTNTNLAEILKGDSLTQFAMVFSAMIHDVDHPGVTNAQVRL